jgi:hypothetical protein
LVKPAVRLQREGIAELMGAGLLGVAVLLALIWGGKSVLRADPRMLARVIRSGLGSLGLGFGLSLMASGRIAPGLILIAAGVWALGWLPSRLQADLDRRFPGGRENADADGHPRQVHPARPGAMTEQQAYQILGLDPGAGDDAVRAAHRSLIRKLHPDAGGVSALAAQVNEAKDVLLKGHG